jgi:hypothetical protein
MAQRNVNIPHKKKLVLKSKLELEVSKYQHQVSFV